MIEIIVGLHSLNNSYTKLNFLDIDKWWESTFVYSKANNVFSAFGSYKFLYGGVNFKEICKEEKEVGGNYITNHKSIIVLSNTINQGNYSKTKIYKNTWDLLDENKNLIICGGKSVYRQFMRYADVITVLHSEWHEYDIKPCRDLFPPILPTLWDRQIKENNLTRYFKK